VCSSDLQSCDRLSRLVGDILDLSKAETSRLQLKSEPFDFLEVMRSAEELFRPFSRDKGLDLRLRLDAAIPQTLVGDGSRLQQVLHNLLGNALKFTETGNVRLEAWRLPQSIAGRCRILFIVTDTGIGMHEDKLDAMFRPFSQEDASHTRKYEGAGLGLAISRNLVTLMGGAMSVVTAKDQGSTFYVSIPFEVYTEQNPARTTATVVLRDTAVACNVLVAEDDPVSRLAVVLFLETCGCQVTAVENGAKALEALRESPFDLVFMDVEMPVLDGVHATQAIRKGVAGEDRAGTRIIALTACAMKGDRERCLAAGMDDYLAKPVDVESLLAKLTR